MKNTALTNTQKSKLLKRSSGIELLKVTAIMLIVISHAAQTLNPEEITYIPYQDYFINLSLATANVRYFLLSVFRTFGALGNTIFFVSSAWFLLDSKTANKKKIINMLVEVWIISFILLIVTLILKRGAVEPKVVILRQLLPTTYANNWYVTCYMLFYLIHPMLNLVIYKLKREELLKATLMMVFLYIIVNYIRDGFFFPSALTLWTAIYFAMAYMKLYMKDFSSNKSYNLILLISGISAHLAVLVITNLLGLRIGYFEDKLLRWGNVNSNPFLITAAVSLLNLARGMKFKNYFINYLSSLSLLIYIIHENLVVRVYLRPYIMNYICTNYGYSHIVLWVLLFAAALFVLSAAAASLYKLTVRRLLPAISEMVYAIVSKMYKTIEKQIFKLN